MKANLPYIQEKFRHYNELIFDGQLPEPPISICDVKTFLGKCTFKMRKKLFGKVEYCDFKLRFNKRIELTEDEMDDIIIHEMIHYYTGWKRLQDSSAHGPLFRRLMEEINARYGRHISITHHLTDSQKNEMMLQDRKSNVLAVVTFKSGRRSIKVLPSDRNKVLKYYHTVGGARAIRSVELYFSENPYFNRYPRSAAFNAFRIDSPILDENLKGATPLSPKQLPF